MIQVDAVIAGAGVIGLACGYRLAQKGLSVFIVEKHGRVGQVTSSRNSQVIHAGMYYPPDSLKAKLCVAGNRSLKAYCAKAGVTMVNTGKYIVATNEREEAELLGIFDRGRQNGVEQLELVAHSEVHKAEPALNVKAALWSPNTAIVDTHQLCASLLGNFEDLGGQIIYHHEITGATRNGTGYDVFATNPSGEISEVSCSYFINAAGLYSDLLCEKSGFDIDRLGYRLKFVKGNYFRVQNPSRFGIKHLVYPAPPADLKGLGIHLTLDLDGSLRLGPDTEEITGRTEQYHVDETKATAFAEAVSRFLPAISPEDLYPDSSGIRPRLSSTTGKVPDFIIREESAAGFPGWINLIGIESPGLTCSLEIAGNISEYVG